MIVRSKAHPPERAPAPRLVEPMPQKHPAVLREESFAAAAGNEKATRAGVVPLRHARF